MKNKLLVSVFAVGIALFAFTSCETKSNVTEVCTDLLKESLHKTPRSLQKLDGETLTIYEYEFESKKVDDPGLIYRSITFGNGVETVVKEVKSTYQYGEWQDNNTAFTLHVQALPEPYTLVYQGNSLITPDGLAIGGEGTDNTARVAKFEKVTEIFPNTTWTAHYEGEYVMDSIFVDSVKVTFIPPMTFKYDTIKVFSGKMDTLSADTTSTILITFERTPLTGVNVGHYYQKSVRSKYDRKTKETTIISENIREYDFNWFFSDVTSDAKFIVTTKSLNPGVEGEKLSISKFKLDEAGKPSEFLLGGLTYNCVINLPTE